MVQKLQSGFKWASDSNISFIFCTFVENLIIKSPLAAINSYHPNLTLKGANLKTLVYFASGPSKDVYESLPFDRIFLVDYCFIGKGNRTNRFGNPNIQISQSGKVICLGMDLLDSINYMKQHKVKIDCFVVLNEGLSEGGGKFAGNSDMFIGYTMPILNDEYIHIMNKNYYGPNYHVTMDLPYLMTEMSEGDQDYLDPFIFSDDSYHEGYAKVFRMKKYISVENIKINPNIQLSIIHDSIWNYKEELGLIAISITPQGQGDFFTKSNKVVSFRDFSVTEILDICVQNKIERIGFTPWLKGKYSSFVDQISNYTQEYPKVISLFHLNQKDYKSLKELA